MTGSKLGTRKSTQPPSSLTCQRHSTMFCMSTCSWLCRPVALAAQLFAGSEISLRSETEGSGQQQVVFFLHVQQGGPPGRSVLGPLLFNIYVADLPSLAREHGAKMPSFAEDMTLYCSHTSAALACSTVSTALKDTFRALVLRGLSINVSKTVAMVIAPHSRACQGLPTGVRLLLQNEEAKLVSQTRLLGNIIDDSLSWSPHVDSICKKVAGKLVLYVVRTDNWPPRQEGNSSSQWFSQIWSMLLQQPYRSCRLVNKIDFWRSGERPSMPGRCSSPRRCLTTDQKFKADSLISSLVPTTSPPSDAVTNSLLRRYSWRNLVSMSTSMVPSGDNRVTFDHFSRRHWLVVSLSPTGHLSCGKCFPGRCKPAVPC